MRPEKVINKISFEIKHCDPMTQAICHKYELSFRRTEDNMVAAFSWTYKVKYWECVIIEEHSDASPASITMNNRRKLYPPDAFPVGAKRRRKACCNIPPSNVARSIPHYLKDALVRVSQDNLPHLYKILEIQVKISQKKYNTRIYIRHGEGDKP